MKLRSAAVIKAKRHLKYYEIFNVHIYIYIKRF